METYYIYKIACKDESVTDCYVGSSKDIKERARAHKTKCHNENSPQYNLKIYQTIRNNGGWENYKLIVLEEMINTTTSEATKREEQLRIELGANLNSQKASTGFGYIGLTKLESNRERVKIWQEQNREKKIEYQKEYKILNKQKISENKNEYYKNHKEKISEYKILHKEKIKEYQKEYYEKTLEYRKEYRILNKQKNKEYDRLRYQKLKAKKFIENTTENYTMVRLLVEEVVNEVLDGSFFAI